MKWNWGVGIAASYILFAAATSGFVVFAMNRPVSLVRPDYYAESLREDQQMEARARAQQLGAAVAIAVEARDTIRIAVPRTAPESTIAGRVTLYRASDPAADRSVAFTPDAAGVQRLAVSGLRPGHWIVKLQWTSGGRDYYVEQPIVLP
jgi:hypothetical protein